MGDDLEAVPLEPSAVDDERLESPAPRGAHGHGPDLPYLRAGCEPWIQGPEREPEDPPGDPSDPLASLYVRAPLLEPVSALRTAPRGTLAYLRDEAIWISAADGTSRRRLVQAPWKSSKTDPVAHGAPRFVFGGDELLFVTTQGDPRGRIVRFDRECRYASSVGTRICDDSKPCFDPTRAALVVSPDGKRVLVEGLTASKTPLRLLDLVTGREEVAAPHHDAPAAWSPDGDRIAYRPDFERGIVVADLRAGTRDVVTHPSIRTHSAPEFGADGLTLWFAANTDFDEFTLDTSLMRTTVPSDLSTRSTPPPYAREHLLSSFTRFQHPTASIARGPRAERFAVVTGHVMVGLDAWTSAVSLIPTTPGATVTFTFGKGRSTPHHRESWPQFAPEGELVAAVLETLPSLESTRPLRKIAVTDGVVEAFVATGHSVDWTAAE